MWAIQRPIVSSCSLAPPPSLATAKTAPFQPRSFAACGWASCRWYGEVVPIPQPSPCPPRPLRPLPHFAGGEGPHPPLRASRSDSTRPRAHQTGTLGSGTRHRWQAAKHRGAAVWRVGVGGGRLLQVTHPTGRWRNGQCRRQQSLLQRPLWRRTAARWHHRPRPNAAPTSRAQELRHPLPSRGSAGGGGSGRGQDSSASLRRRADEAVPPRAPRFLPSGITDGVNGGAMGG